MLIVLRFMEDIPLTLKELNYISRAHGYVFAPTNTL